MPACQLFENKEEAVLVVVVVVVVVVLVLVLVVVGFLHLMGARTG